MSTCPGNTRGLGNILKVFLSWNMFWNLDFRGFVLGLPSNFVDIVFFSKLFSLRYMFFLIHQLVEVMTIAYGIKYSRKDQVKFVEDRSITWSIFEYFVPYVNVLRSVQYFFACCLDLLEIICMLLSSRNGVTNV